MTVTSVGIATRNRRWALFLLFWLPGVALASWVTRTPAIRDSLGASTAHMGLILFGLSIGSMVGILNSTRLIRRIGTKWVVTIGTAVMLSGVAWIALGALLASSVIVFVGLLSFGLGMGTGEIAMNIEGADVERIIARPVLTSLHGFFSLGTVVGATIGIALTTLNFSVAVHLAVVAVLCLPAIGAVRFVPSGVGKRSRTSSSADLSSDPAVPVWRDNRLLLIGVVVLAMALAEGAATDWLPLLMVDGHGFDAAMGSVVYAAFAASMAAGRFSGTAILRRVPRATVVRFSALLGALGLAIVVFSPSPEIAAVAVVLWGLGASLGFPTAISAAGDGDGDRSSAVSAVATSGYIAFLVGPPLLGFLGEHFGLRYAMVVVLVLMVVAAACASSTSPPKNVSDVP